MTETQPATPIGVAAPTITYNAAAGYNFTPPFGLLPVLIGAAGGWALGNYMFRGRHHSKNETLTRLGMAAAGAYVTNFILANAGSGA